MNKIQFGQFVGSPILTVETLLPKKTSFALMKRLLFIINDAHFFNTSRLPVALAAKELGYDVHVATADSDASALLTDKGLTFHPMPLSRSGRNPIRELFLMAKIYLLLRRLKPDLVHNISIKPVLYGGLLARLAKVPSAAFAVSGLGTVFLATIGNALVAACSRCRAVGRKV